MPRTYKQKSIVSGMSVNDILNIDNNLFNSLTESDLRKVVGRLVSAGNKRLRSFERNDTRSPAVGKVMRSGGVFSTKGKDLNALRAEYVRAKSFLQSKMGMVKQWKKIKQDTISTLKKRGVDLTKDQFDLVFRIYDRLAELDPSIEDKRYKYHTLDEINDALVKVRQKEDSEDLEDLADIGDIDALIDTVVDSMQTKITELYEEEQANDSGGVSNFFDLGGSLPSR